MNLISQKHPRSQKKKPADLNNRSETNQRGCDGGLESSTRWF